MIAETRVHLQFSLSSTSSLLNLPDIRREASVSNLHNNLSTDFESTISNSQVLQLCHVLTPTLFFFFGFVQVDTQGNP